MLKHFFEMNDIDDEINSPKISKIIPHAKKTGSDRPHNRRDSYNVRLADIRTKCVILTCSSSGIRVGALEEMIWND